jgi:N-acetylmuramoyl-L-alanine amidase
MLLLFSAVADAQTVGLQFYRNGDFVWIQRPIAPGASPTVEDAVRALVDGPTAQESSEGVTTSIPAGTTIVGLTIGEDEVVVDLSSEVLADIDETRLSAIFDQFRLTLSEWPKIAAVRLTCKGQPLASYVAPVNPIPEAAPATVPAGITTSVGLSGKKITIGPSHGRFWNGSGWYWQRSDPCGLGEAVLEDTNSIRLMQFLYQYLSQDGATVTVPRQLDEGDCCHSETGLNWWKMCAYSWLKHAGLPCSVYANSTGNCNAETATGRINDDIRARPLYADYVGADIYIAHHTNAGGSGTARGTETYHDTSMEHSAHETNSTALATSVQNNVIGAIRDMYDSCWVSRGVKDSTGNFGEIRIPDRPAILIELAFHDGCNASSVGCGNKDTDALTSDYFRSVAEWGLYKGICEYFGVTPGWDKYSDQYVSDTLPTEMKTGEVYTATVTFRNRGVLWSDAYGFRLGAVDDSDPFTTSTRSTMGATVRPGATYTFTVVMTAPSTPGTYTTDWRMVRDGVAWFGDTVTKQVTVALAGIPGDMDGDWDVDMEDFGPFQACLTGVGIAQYDTACTRAHMDNDTDVDETDVAKFINCLTGPGVTGNADCAGS